MRKRPQLAIVPTGTTNDFARALKIPRGKPLEAIEIIGKNQILNIDVGHAVIRETQDEQYLLISLLGAV